MASRHKAQKRAKTNESKLLLWKETRKTIQRLIDLARANGATLVRVQIRDDDGSFRSTWTPRLARRLARKREEQARLAQPISGLGNALYKAWSKTVAKNIHEPRRKRKCKQPTISRPPQRLFAPSIAIRKLAMELAFGSRPKGEGAAVGPDNQTQYWLWLTEMARLMWLRRATRQLAREKNKRIRRLARDKMEFIGDRK